MKIVLTTVLSIIALAGVAQFKKNDYFTAPPFFTADNDGKQDTWKITWKRDIDSAKIEIFSRYGDRLLSTTNKDIEWDGKDSKGKQWGVKETLACVVTIWHQAKKTIVKGIVNHQLPNDAFAPF